MAAFPPLRLCLIAPPLDGQPTGGTLYNRSLTAALRRTGATVRTCALDEPLTSDHRDLTLVDSLYLTHLPELQKRVPAQRLHLLLHYLPAQVRLARAVAIDELSAAERSALTTAAGFVVTSGFMQQQLLALSIVPQRVRCIEPGTTPIIRTPDRGSCLQALMLANVVEGKGLMPLLQALAVQLQASDDLVLEVAGSLDAEPGYSAACRQLIAAHPLLRDRVHLLGTLEHEHALDRLARAHVLVSASRMESYGMALAEARAAGVPIVARMGGNAFQHVERVAGGALCDSPEQLARELLQLARNADLLAARDQLARAAVRARSWDDAASELHAAQRSIAPE